MLDLNQALLVVNNLAMLQRPLREYEVMLQEQLAMFVTVQTKRLIICAEEHLEEDNARRNKKSDETEAQRDQET